jgi:hypothetical protein
MSNHLAWTDFDMHYLNGALNDWAKKGFEGELETREAESGVVAITTRNWTSKGAPFVTMEIHKLKGKNYFFGWQRTRWVIRLFSCESYERAFSVMHGCATSWNMTAALNMAMLDVGHGFISRSSLEDYFE